MPTFTTIPKTESSEPRRLHRGRLVLELADGTKHETILERNSPKQLVHTFYDGQPTKYEFKITYLGSISAYGTTDWKLDLYEFYVIEWARSGNTYTSKYQGRGHLIFDDLMSLEYLGENGSIGKIVITKPE